MRDRVRRFNGAAAAVLLSCTVGFTAVQLSFPIVNTESVTPPNWTGGQSCIENSPGIASSDWNVVFSQKQRIQAHADARKHLEMHVEVLLELVLR